MLNIDIDVVRGVMFINLEGELNKRTVSLFEEEINYLVYKQGMHLFVFNFNNLNNTDSIIYNNITIYENSLDSIMYAVKNNLIVEIDVRMVTNFTPQVVKTLVINSVSTALYPKFGRCLIIRIIFMKL